MLSNLLFLFALAAPSDMSMLANDDNRVQCGATLTGAKSVLTAAHCVDSDTARFTCGEKVIEGELVSYSELSDQASFDLAEPCNLKPAKIARTPVKVGDNISLVSCPADECGTFSKGYIARMLVKNGHRFFAADLKIFFGSSGSGVFNERGELIAVVSAMFTISTPDGDSVVWSILSSVQ